ncbi:hypothetical protein PARPLA_01409 [Rhodobacteraceae bacterium THAF1]|nr:hypothetical protein FIU81_12055 [Palleronia sp. THAF1]VDC21968.1 hypothetical protein PARPLA_01409 [Rhodobacteraceae bacterium THAF1]
MNDLVSVGGVVVDADAVCSLENELQELCASQDYQIPSRENVKWSPTKKSWLRKNLSGEQRQDLYGKFLDIAAQHDCQTLVAICDPTLSMATDEASNHEMDATLLALERFSTYLGKESGLVVVSRPGGGHKEADKFLCECVELKESGTAFVKFQNLAQAPFSQEASRSRILQLADLVVSITTSKVSHSSGYADKHFEKIVPLFPESSRGVKGGVGLKIHPSLRYRNLYHWILGDAYYVERNMGTPLPQMDKPYCKSSERWR